MCQESGRPGPSSVIPVAPRAAGQRAVEQVAPDETGGAGHQGAFDERRRDAHLDGGGGHDSAPGVTADIGGTPWAFACNPERGPRGSRTATFTARSPI